MQQTRCMNCMKEIAPGTRICPHCGYDQQTEQIPNALRPNTILHGRYLVGCAIGKGGFGITYVGFDLMLEVKVAIKEYFPSGSASRNGRSSNQVTWESQNQNYGTVQDARTMRQESMDRVLKEARRTAKLSGVPTVVRVNEVFQENETAYIVMDFIEGLTLKDYLMKHGVMTWEECQKLLFPVMDALAQAHDLGIVHRDISPDNIMIEPDGTVRLLDLGAAVDINANKGHASMAVVKSHFSPVEQYDENGKIGSWTDVYAFAATLYYCLTGKLLTPVLERIRNPEIIFPNGENIPDPVKTALCGALAIYEDERTQDMKTFKKELVRTPSLGGNNGGGQPPVPPVQPPISPKKSDLTIVPMKFRQLAVFVSLGYIIAGMQLYFLGTEQGLFAYVSDAVSIFAMLVVGYFMSITMLVSAKGYQGNAKIVLDFYNGEDRTMQETAELIIKARGKGDAEKAIKVLIRDSKIVIFMAFLLAAVSNVMIFALMYLLT